MNDSVVAVFELIMLSTCSAPLTNASVGTSVNLPVTTRCYSLIDLLVTCTTCCYSLIDVVRTERYFLADYL